MKRRRSWLGLAACAALGAAASAASPGGPLEREALLLALGATAWVGLGAGVIGALVGYLAAALAVVVPLRALLDRLFDGLRALPLVLLVPLLAQGGGPPRLLLALALVRAAQVAQATLQQARALEAEGFAEAALALGVSRARLFSRHLGPFLRPGVLLSAASGSASACTFEVLLGFLGFTPGGLGERIAHAMARGDVGASLTATLVAAATVAALSALAGALSPAPGHPTEA